MVEISYQAARRFAKFVGAIVPSEYHYHQTLSFKDPDCRNNLGSAYDRFKTYLEWIVKAYPTAGIIWVRENSEEKANHFHLLFLLFGEQKKSPQDLLPELAKDLFDHWNSLNGGELNEGANLITLPPHNLSELHKSVRYFVVPRETNKPRKVKIVSRKERDKISWWGFRNLKTLTLNSRSLSKKEVSDIKHTIFREKRSYPKPQKPQEDNIMDTLPRYLKNETPYLRKSVPYFIYKEDYCLN
jgi:hypothetical protein